MDIQQRDRNLEAYPFEWKSDPVLLEMKVRSLIFIITGVCAGLPALIWSVSDIIHHRKNGLRISDFLLITDFIEFLLSPYILIKLLLNELLLSTGDTHTFLSAVWLSARAWGFLLNPMVAIDGILESPHCTASVFSSACCIVFYLLMILSIIIGSFLSHIFLLYISILILFAAFYFIMTFAFSFELLCSSYYHTSRKPDCHILAVLIFSLLIYISYFLSLVSSLVPNIVVILLSLRLISDPLLCVLVCRQNLNVQNSRNPEESLVQSE